MGLLISRLWGKRSTAEVLQRLEDERSALEETRVAVHRRQHRLRTAIWAYSLLLYLVAAGVMYWRGLPSDVTRQLMAAATLLLFPTVMYLLKGVLSWYYERKIAKSEARMIEIKKKKEEILEEVQDKETYKVARQILEKFAPEQLRRSSPRPGALLSSPEEEGSLRQRHLVPAGRGRAPLASTPRLSPAVLPLPPGAQGQIQPTPIVPGSGRFSGRSPLVQSPTAMRGRGLPALGGRGRSGPQLTRPVLPRERGYMDRVMDYLVGDGPANRYALICCQCQGHNGMALQEEFPYLAFRCCYCYAWNPARKQRPTAPRLPAAPTSDSMQESDTTETTDSEPEVPVAAVCGGEPAPPVVAMADGDTNRPGLEEVVPAAGSLASPADAQQAKEHDSEVAVVEGGDETMESHAVLLPSPEHQPPAAATSERTVPPDNVSEPEPVQMSQMEPVQTTQTVPEHIPASETEKESETGPDSIENSGTELNPSQTFGTKLPRTCALEPEPSKTSEAEPMHVSEMVSAPDDAGMTCVAAASVVTPSDPLVFVDT